MNELLFEKIDAYLKGTLSAAERESFEAEMEEDASLREEVVLHQQMIHSIETEAVRQLLDEIHEESFSSQTPVVPIRKRFSFSYMAVAASVALLILAGWWFFQYQASQPEALYTAYFRPAAGLPTTLGASENTRFAEGMVSYKLEAYAEALEWWQPLLAADPTNDTLNYYMGVASLAQEQIKHAITYLQQVSRLENSVYQTDAQWYLALAYLRNQEEDKAKTLLEALVQQNTAYDDKIRELLEKI